MGKRAIQYFTMKDTIQFITILGLMAYIIFLQQCKSNPTNNLTKELLPDTTIVVDTLMPKPIIVQMPRQTIPEPIIIYIDSSQQIVPASQINPVEHETAQLYQDSIEDENLTLYYKSMVQGKLLDYNLNYKLKVPKQITQTITITKPIPMPAYSLWFNTGTGINPNGFASLTFGLQFISKKGWSLGYGYDVLQNQHELTLGVQLWRQKGPK